MSAKINIYSDQWVELVFQNKNKLYGAYDMRKTSSNRHAKALFISVTVFVVAILSPILIKNLTERMREKDESVRVLKNINLEKPKEQEIPKPLAPPPPPIRSTVKFVPPVIKPDAEVPEDEKPMINEDLNKMKEAIGVTDVKGTTDDRSVPVAEVVNVVEEEEPLVVVEQPAEFEGGERALMKFVASNVRYPTVAQETGVTGVVIVRFVVGADGAISRISVLRGIGSGCDEEAIRVVKKLPSWKPGRQGGRAVPVWFTLPIRFSLE